MRKIITCLLAVVMALSLVACGGERMVDGLPRHDAEEQDSADTPEMGSVTEDKAENTGDEASLTNADWE